MEFPVMGEYHDNLSLEEALKIYETIPEERMHGIKVRFLNSKVKEPGFL